MLVFMRSAHVVGLQRPRRYLVSSDSSAVTVRTLFPARTTLHLSPGEEWIRNCLGKGFSEVFCGREELSYVLLVSGTELVSKTRY